MRKLLFTFVFSLVITVSCTPPLAPSKEIQLVGSAMGTTYSIKYIDPAGRDFKSSIDSLLVDLNNYVSTYQDDSHISKWNAGDKVPYVTNNKHDHFLANVLASQRIHQLTGGAFDPTVRPIVKFWGLYATDTLKSTSLDTGKVSELRKLVGMDKVKVDSANNHYSVGKSPGVMLDFNAIAQGYGVDLVAKLLQDRGVKDYLVEIGGEVVASGLNKNGKVWRVGINTPSEKAGLDDYQAVVGLKDRALATSGNYRKFKTVNGIRVSHTINPKTCRPELNNLLSASIFANDATTADALATACMVMGFENTIEFLKPLQGVDAYLIYSNDSGTMSVWKTSGVLLD